MIALAAHRLIFLLRLALVAALAGYTLPSVSLAMHGSSSASYAAPAVAEAAQVDHYNEVASVSHDHDGKIDHHAKKAGDEAGKTLKQDCCSDFCLNLALVGNGPVFGFDRTPLPVSFVDDELVFAEPIRFNRPPALQA